MQVILIVYELYTRQHLLGNHQHRLEGKLAIADLQVGLERVAEQLSDKEVEVTILAVP